MDYERKKLLVFSKIEINKVIMDQVKLNVAAFGMGCFWSPDSLLGGKEGVIRTRVGYAGGARENPTYTNIGNHTETVLIEYDSNKISYSKLLELFWNNHHYSTSGKKNQYASRIFYTTEEQKSHAIESKSKKEQKEKVATEIKKLNFTAAEDYHQKYRLRHSALIKNFSEMSSKEFRDSPLAAKLNAYTAGYLDLEDLQKLDLEIEPNLKDRLINSVRKVL